MSVVLIAEDEQGALELISEVVEQLGHQVLRTRDGEEALVLARAHTPALIISDYMMPRRSGLSLLRELRQDPSSPLAQIPFLLMSAAQPKGAEAANLFLSKPVQIEEIERAIRKLLEGRPVPEPRTVPGSGPVSSPSQPDAHLRDEMLNWVAHEIRTPLNAARMSAELVLRRTANDEEVEKRIKLIVRQLDHMERLLRSILEAARLADGKIEVQLESHDLAEFMQGTVTLWRELQPGYQLEFRPPPGPLVVRMDPQRIRQIVDNLLSNAVKYGLPSKRIVIELGASPAFVSVKVIDFGPGIPASEIPRLFDRFYQVERSGRGHGLGLYISASLARLHGGSLNAASVLGQGSTFTLMLPRRS